MAAAMRAIGARKASAAATAKASYYADNEHTRTEEHRRLREAEGRIADWKLLGPYVSERAWGTVREDYSANGDAWRFFVHEHARSRAYRWNEDGLAGWCNRFQNVVLSLAFWNGRDPILKERLFGLGSHEGNHGEDVKEIYYYADATPSHSWGVYRYFYPFEYPYGKLVDENSRRSRRDPEYELFEAYGPERWQSGEFWDITASYAKASPTELLCRVQATNCSSTPAEIHILPHLFFRNTWSWGYDPRKPWVAEAAPPPGSEGDAGAGAGGAAAGPSSSGGRTVQAVGFERHTGHLRWSVHVPECSDGFLAQPAELLLTDNETNFVRLYNSPDNVPAGSTAKKDAFHTYVCGDNAYGPPGSVALTLPQGSRGTKAAVWTVQEVPPGGTAEVWIRFSLDGTPTPASAPGATAAAASAPPFVATAPASPVSAAAAAASATQPPNALSPGRESAPLAPLQLGPVLGRSESTGEFFELAELAAEARTAGGAPSARSGLASPRLPSVLGGAGGGGGDDGFYFGEAGGSAGASARSRLSSAGAAVEMLGAGGSAAHATPQRGAAGGVYVGRTPGSATPQQQGEDEHLGFSLSAPNSPGLSAPSRLPAQGQGQATVPQSASGGSLSVTELMSRLGGFAPATPARGPAAGAGGRQVPFADQLTTPMGRQGSDGGSAGSAGAFHGATGPANYYQSASTAAAAAGPGAPGQMLMQRAGSELSQLTSDSAGSSSVDFHPPPQPQRGSSFRYPLPIARAGSSDEQESLPDDEEDEETAGVEDGTPGDAHRRLLGTARADEEGTIMHMSSGEEGSSDGEAGGSPSARYLTSGGVDIYSPAKACAGVDMQFHAQSRLHELLAAAQQQQAQAHGSGDATAGNAAALQLPIDSDGGAGGLPSSSTGGGPTSGRGGLTRALSYYSDGHHGDFHGVGSSATLMHLLSPQDRDKAAAEGGHGQKQGGDATQRSAASGAGALSKIGAGRMSWRGTRLALAQLGEPAGASPVDKRTTLSLAGPGGSRRLGAHWSPLGLLGFDDFLAIVQARKDEADEFYDAIQPPGLSNEDRSIQRQAFSGLLWSKQFYHLGVGISLDGDPAFPPPPPERRKGRNAHWAGHFYANEVLQMPDKFEYPWFAAWDLALQMLPTCIVDPEFAKRQLILMTREWYMHPSGALPAYEYNFDDLSPPVHAYACWRVYQITKRVSGVADLPFLERCFHKLLLNFSFWSNKKDAGGNNLFEGGFLGLDNIGVFDRSTLEGLPPGVRLEQADATAWMAMYCADMLSISLELAQVNPSYEDIASKFFEHFVTIAHSMNPGQGTQHAATTAASASGAAPAPGGGAHANGLWDEEEGFFFDHLTTPDGHRRPVKIKSFVGLIPLFASVTIEDATLRRLPGFSARMQWFLKHRRSMIAPHYHAPAGPNGTCHLLSLVSRAQLPRLLHRMLREDAFLSPHGIRSLSKEHEAVPFTFSHGGFHASLRYEAAESCAEMFGGNSNWRGPVWFPVNYLLVERLQVLDHYFGHSMVVELPTGSANRATLWGVATEISERMINIFRRTPLPGVAQSPTAAGTPVASATPTAATASPTAGDAASPLGSGSASPKAPLYAPGDRPCHGPDRFFSTDQRFGELIPFYEFFNGDTGAGLGARCQTGWTAMVAKLLQQTASNNMAAASEAGGLTPAAAAGVSMGAGATSVPAPSVPTLAALPLPSASSDGSFAPGTFTKAKPAVKLPGRLNLGPIDTGTVLDLQALGLQASAATAAAGRGPATGPPGKGFR